MGYSSLCRGALEIARSEVRKVGTASASVSDHCEIDPNLSIVGLADNAVSSKLLLYFEDYAMRNNVNLKFHSEQVEEGVKQMIYGETPITVCVDEVDGTRNMLAGGTLPYCTLIAIVEGHEFNFGDVRVAGAQFHHNADLFLATKGEGVMKNNDRVYASRTSTLDVSTAIMFDLYARGMHLRMGRTEQARVLDALNKDAWLRDFGCTGVSFSTVAEGGFDGCIIPIVKSYEIGTGYLLLKEAGATLATMNGKRYEDDTPFVLGEDYSCIAACTEELFEEISKKLV